MVIKQKATQFPENQAPRRTHNANLQHPPQRTPLRPLRAVRGRHITPLDDLFFCNSGALANSVLGDDYGPAITKS